MSNESRIQSGIPTGGQFATRNRETDAIVLSDAYDRLMDEGGVADLDLTSEMVSALSPAGVCAVSNHIFPVDGEFPECARCGIEEKDVDPDKHYFDDDDDDEGYDDVMAGGVLIASSRHIEL